MKRVQITPAEKSKRAILPFATYVAGEMNKVRRHHSLEEKFRCCWCSKCQLCCEGQWCASCKWNSPSLSIQSCAKLIYYKWESFHRNPGDGKCSCSFLFSQVLRCEDEDGQRCWFFSALELGKLQSVQHWALSLLLSGMVTPGDFAWHLVGLHLIRMSNCMGTVQQNNFLTI